MDDGFALENRRRRGLISNMKDYPYSATGVGRWIMTSATAYSGCTARKRLDRRKNNTSRGCMLLKIVSKSCNWSLCQIEAPFVHNGWVKPARGGSDELRVRDERDCTRTEARA